MTTVLVVCAIVMLVGFVIFSLARGLPPGPPSAGEPPDSFAEGSSSGQDDGGGLDAAPGDGGANGGEGGGSD